MLDSAKRPIFWAISDAAISGLYNFSMVYLSREFGPNKKGSWSNLALSLVQSDRNLKVLIPMIWTAQIFVIDNN